MTKNIIITVLALAVMMCWIRVDPECIMTDYSNSVVIEYDCDNLEDYENVPPEVVDECRSRVNEIVKNKNNT